MKFAKVMLSQVSIHRGDLGLHPGDLCPGGGISVQGVSVQEGVCPRVSVQGDLCPEGSLSKGISVQGGFLHGGSLHGGSLSRGSLSRGSLPGGSLSIGSVPWTETPRTIMSVQYASYWNAFLFCHDCTFVIRIKNRHNIVCCFATC